ncbi:MAG TPA: PQQ-binding-like beta-propeller repeat protein [Acidimicrobiia bacterium]|nr:PQQ-binding-like beta-propeller repeat protein [Acidimicrobiia bacterium]
MRGIRGAVAFVAVALVATACSSSGSSTRKDVPTTKAARAPGADAIPPEVRDHAADWPLPGHDYANSRHATDSPIDVGTIARLASAWTATLSAGASTAPLVVGDTVYVEDGSGSVSALDRATGAPRWHYASHDYNIGPYGVAVANGTLFATTPKGIVALDATTGAKRWTRDLNRTRTEGVDIDPTVFDGMVLVSTVPISIQGQFAAGDRGTIHALDARTGADVWSFDTVESKDLWGHPDVNSGGGAWYAPAVDTARGVVYFGTGNPAPFPGTKAFPNGSSRPGADLYSDSILALGTSDGALHWYFQPYPHDLFDRDFVHTMLVDVKRGATTQTVVVGTGKGGEVLGFDRDTGKLLWRTKVGEHDNDQLTSLTGPTAILPGTYGGVETPPASADGVVYVATLNAPTTLSPDKPSYIGSEFGTKDGEMVAVDAATGRVLWDSKVPGDPFGAATVVNGLVLTTTYNGMVVAYDRHSGRIVWQYQLPGKVNGWMTIAGDLLLVPVGIANPPQLVALRLPAG